MSKIYKVVGLHCEECSESLANRLITEGIEFDLLSSTLEILQEDQYEKIKLLVAENNAFLIPMINELSSEREHDKNHHHHHHEHAHHHAEKNIGIAFLLNLVFSIGEFIFGGMFNSQAIMSDAVHDLGDALSIGVAWFLQKISTREPDDNYNDGYGRFSVLGSIITGIILLIGSIIMIIRSIPRLFHPEIVNYQGMLWMAIIAVIINVIAGYLMSQGSSNNEKILSLHMLEDILGWIAVLIVAFVLKYTDWYILDPILSIVIASLILWQVIPLLLDSIRIMLDESPVIVDMESVRQQILAVEDVHGIANIHSHSIDGEHNVFSATLFVGVDDAKRIEQIKDQVKQILAKKSFNHITLETMIDNEKIIK